MNSELLWSLVKELFSALHVLPFIFRVASYVLMGLGLYTLAKDRSISGAWLSWVPGVNVWILGSLADQYRYVAKGQRTNRRKTLLGLKIVGWLVSAIALGLSLTGVTRIIFNLFDPTVVVSEEAMLSGLLRWGMKSIGFFIVMIPIQIALAVFYFMALYDLYMSCDPKNAVLYLVLSILVGVTRPFFVFFDRDKELGMPPRKPQPSFRRTQAAPEPQAAPEEEDEDLEMDDEDLEEDDLDPEEDQAPEACRVSAEQEEN